MATVITELNKVPSEREVRKTYNISLTDASTAIDLLAAVSDTRYGINSIDICGGFAGTEWFKIFDGDNILVGPRILSSGIPWVRKFEETVYGTKNTALKLQTKNALLLNLIIEVAVSLPNPSSSPSSSPSASPSA